MNQVSKLALIGPLLACTACTGQLPGSFRLAQQDQTFNSNLNINTKIDLLWVVDNSSSMDIDQKKLRNGFAAFAQKYMQPTWDIQVAVITTDVYLAHPAFQSYLKSTVPGSVGYVSPYINSRLTSWVNPKYKPTMINLTTGAMDNGVTINDMLPNWGANYSKLLPGLHDGPITALCFEGLPYFLKGTTRCTIRDNQNGNTGSGHCVNPSANEDSFTQCVNTAENDTIHSGKAIISTQPPAGVAADSQWTNQLVDNFIINVSTGSAGHGSERGMGSVLQLIQDNESTSTALFRPGSLRGIIFVSDEDDQTFVIEKTPPANFGAWTHYMCDQASLLANNTAALITGNRGLCCSNVANSCAYGSEGTSCPSKTVDNYTYTLSICPITSLLMPVPQVKTQLDAFFNNLDAANSITDNPNSYFVASIVALTGDAVSSLQASRNQDDIAATQSQGSGGLKTTATDRGDRYIELGNEVGNGSMSMNIADDDYSPILDAIGQTITQKKGTFTLSQAPTNASDMIVTILHADGSTTVITSDQFVLEDKNLVITDMNLILSFTASDKIEINYQPNAVF